MARTAPFCAAGALGAAVSIYFSPGVANNYTSAILIAFGLGLQMVSTPLNLTMLQGFVPTRVISLAAGLMGGISFSVASFVPAAIGYAISVTGGFHGGFYILVGLSLAGALSALVLTFQKY